MRKLFYLSLFLLATGCAKVVDDFVVGGEPGGNPTPVPQPSTDPDPSHQLKLSPGMVRSTGGTVGMTAHITKTRHVMTGANMSAVVGLHKSR